MNTKGLFLALSLTLTLSLLILSQIYTNQITLTGKISKINIYATSTTIRLENAKEEIVIFTPNLNLKENQTIKVTGKKEVYASASKNIEAGGKIQTQILADKISLQE